MSLKFFNTDAELVTGKSVKCRLSDIERLRHRVNELEQMLKCGARSPSEARQNDDHMAFLPPNNADFSQLQQPDVDPLASNFWQSTLMQSDFFQREGSIGRDDQDSCPGLHVLGADDSIDAFLHSCDTFDPDGNGAQQELRSLPPKTFTPDTFSHSALTGETTVRGRTALMIAAEQGNVAMLEFLVASGADLTTTDESGSTALHVACAYGQQQSVSALTRYLQPSAMNCSNYAGLTPFHVAVRGGHLDISSFLLQQGVNINARD